MDGAPERDAGLVPPADRSTGLWSPGVYAMNIANLIPAKYRIIAMAIAAGLVVIAAVAWWHSHNAVQQEIGYQRSTAEFKEKERIAAADQRTRELANFRNRERAEERRNELEQKLDAIRTAARDATEQLRLARGDFDRRLDAATRETAIAAARTAAALLSECSGEYQSVAAAADGHAADAAQCVAAWPE